MQCTFPSAQFVILQFPVVGRPFVQWFALCYRTVVLSVCLSVCLVCDVGVLLPNGWMDQDEIWPAGRPRPWPHCVGWRPSFPSPKRRQSPPIFDPYLLWPNGWMDQDGTWHGGASLSSGDTVLDGDPAPLTAAPPHFSAHVYCGQTVAHLSNC